MTSVEKITRGLWSKRKDRDFNTKALLNSALKQNFWTLNYVIRRRNIKLKDMMKINGGETA